MTTLNLDEINPAMEAKLADFAEVPVKDVHKIIETLRLVVKVGEILDK